MAPSTLYFPTIYLNITLLAILHLFFYCPLSLPFICNSILPLFVHLPPYIYLFHSLPNTSLITLPLPSPSPRYDAVFAALRDCYEAYAVYTFIALLIAILEDGKGLPQLLNKVSGAVECGYCLSKQHEDVGDRINDDDDIRCAALTMRTCHSSSHTTPAPTRQLDSDSTLSSI
jgi:Organic solute transporter Ostalpha